MPLVPRFYGVRHCAAYDSCPVCVTARFRSLCGYVTAQFRSLRGVRHCGYVTARFRSGAGFPVLRSVVPLEPGLTSRALVSIRQAWFYA